MHRAAGGFRGIGDDAKRDAILSVILITPSERRSSSAWALPRYLACVLKLAAVAVANCPLQQHLCGRLACSSCRTFCSTLKRQVRQLLRLCFIDLRSRYAVANND
jgi:hypothetical protein